MLQALANKFINQLFHSSSIRFTEFILLEHFEHKHTNGLYLKSQHIHFVGKQTQTIRDHKITEN